MEKIIPVEYFTKTIYNISKNFKLKHQVKFGRTLQNGDRGEPLFVSSYDTKNYSHNMEVMTINVDTNDYLVLEYKQDRENQVSIYISYPHLFEIKQLLKNSVQWFYKYDMFIEKDNEIKFNSKYKKLIEETNYTIDRRYISVRPSVVQKDDVYSEGVIMNLNDEYTVGLTIQELESLYNIIDNFDLYQNSLIIMNYILSSHPETLLSANVMSTATVSRSINNQELFNKKHKRKSTK